MKFGQDTKQTKGGLKLVGRLLSKDEALSSFFFLLLECFKREGKQRP